MNTCFKTMNILCLSLLPTLIFGAYGSQLCQSEQYSCIQVKSGQSWDSLFPDPNQRMIVRKVNRMNTPIHGGMTIAVPRNLESVNIMDLAPFPQHISVPSSTYIKVDLGQLAWGAYENGNLVNWGPASGGKGYCPDVHRGCRTPQGNFTVYSKQGPGCISHKFPIPYGGAHMPYCMNFHDGYSLHGYHVVPGFNASHGCIRMFLEDAQWMNQEFVEVGKTRVSVHY